MIQNDNTPLCKTKKPVRHGNFSTSIVVTYKGHIEATCVKPAALDREGVVAFVAGLPSGPDTKGLEFSVTSFQLSKVGTYAEMTHDDGVWAVHVSILGPAAEVPRFLRQGDVETPLPSE